MSKPYVTHVPLQYVDCLFLKESFGVNYCKIVCGSMINCWGVSNCGIEIAGGCYTNVMHSITVPKHEPSSSIQSTSSAPTASPVPVKKEVCQFTTKFFLWILSSKILPLILKKKRLPVCSLRFEKLFGCGKIGS